MRLIDADKITSGEIAKYLGRGYEFCMGNVGKGAVYSIQE